MLAYGNYDEPSDSTKYECGKPYLYRLLYNAGCPQNCESCSNNHDCIKCQPGTSRMVEGSRVACLQNCPSGYSSQGDDKTGHVCLPHRLRKSKYLLEWLAVPNNLLHIIIKIYVTEKLNNSVEAIPTRFLQ